MVDKADALGSDDEALNAAIEAAQAVLDQGSADFVTEVVTALLDLSEAMQALNTDESIGCPESRCSGDDRFHQRDIS